MQTQPKYEQYLKKKNLNTTHILHEQILTRTNKFRRNERKTKDKYENKI